jgi:hypothetical protein
MSWWGTSWYTSLWPSPSFWVHMLCFACTSWAYNLLNVFLGVYKGYQCYDPSSRRIRISRVQPLLRTVLSFTTPLLSHRIHPQSHHLFCLCLLLMFPHVLLFQSFLHVTDNQIAATPMDLHLQLRPTDGYLSISAYCGQPCFSLCTQLLFILDIYFACCDT